MTASSNPPLYSPVLRLKKGELKGVRRLASDVASKIRPRFVIPPPKEVDPEKGRLLTKEEIVYGTGRRIAEHWPFQSAFLDLRFLFRDFGEEEAKDWVPKIFRLARTYGADAIPLLSLKDALGSRVEAYRPALSEGSIKAALRIPFGEINADLAGRVETALARIGLSPSDCVVLADFANADFSMPAIVSEIAQAALEDLQAVGTWQYVVFQGTNFPEANPAQPKSTAVVPRNEWLAWKSAISFDRNSSDHLVFGDYGADSAKFVFPRKGGGIPIRHYRYTTQDSWLVVRGDANGETTASMRDVCERIVGSGMFAGRGFSSADEYIYRTAQGWAGPGGGSEWREMNTAHHITRVVRDIGTIKGLSFSDQSFADPVVQTTIFD